MFVGNLQWTVGDSELQELCAAFNPLHCNVITNINGRSRGFGIVLFRTQEEANTFAAQIHGREVQGRSLVCRVGFNNESAIDKICTVFVGKLDHTVSEDDLYELFSGYGEIEEVTIKRTKEGRSKGWG